MPREFKHWLAIRTVLVYMYGFEYLSPLFEPKTQPVISRLTKWGLSNES